MRLDRSRCDEGVVQPVGRPDVADRLAIEQPSDQADRLGETVEPFAESAAEVESERLVLLAEPAAAEPQDGPATADLVERGRQLRGEARVAKRVRRDQESQPGTRGDRGNRG